MFQGFQVSPDMIVKQRGRFFLMPTMASVGNTVFVIAAPWCGHCQDLSKTLLTASRQFGLNVLYMIGDQDEASSRVMKAMNVSGFPTIFRVLPGGELLPYHGPRTPASLSGYS